MATFYPDAAAKRSRGAEKLMRGPAAQHLTDEADTDLNQLRHHVWRCNVKALQDTAHTQTHTAQSSHEPAVRSGQVVAVHLDRMDGIDELADDVGRISVLSQPTLEHLCQGGVVLDDQNAHMSMVPDET